jgi:hypothetical protein
MFFLCGSLCFLCVTLCKKIVTQSYTEVHRVAQSFFICATYIIHHPSYIIHLHIIPSFNIL